MEPPQVALHVGAKKTLPGEPGEVTPVLVEVTPPTDDKRMPSDICCVIDISGSMGAEATIQSAGGAKESFGLSLLDIAKHGVRTVLNTLGPEDRLCVVWFNHDAGTLFPLTAMDEAGKKIASDKLDTLEQCGGTTIWEGIKQGLDELRAGQGAGAHRLGHMMLLTDGQTNDRNMVLPKLEEYRQQYERLPGTISTFGFGYSIDSPLLVDISLASDGTYAFIPDAGFVGTVFVNCLSNLLVTMARDLTIIVEVAGGAELKKVGGTNRLEKKGLYHHVKFGSLQFGQTRSLILYLEVPPLEASGESEVVVKLSYETCNGREESAGVDLLFKDVATPDPVVESQHFRCAFIKCIMDMMDHAKTSQDARLQQAQLLIADFIKNLEASPCVGQDPMKALLEDAKGQSTVAVSRMDWFQKWGVHYLPSLQLAHMVQQCNNFKDPSVQFYGGHTFKDIQDKADEIFNSLPAPQPSRPRYQSFGRSGTSLSNTSATAVASAAPAPAAAPVSMAAYNDRYGVCIDASSPAQLADGQIRAVGQLAKGDRVAAPGGTVAEVVCMVRTACRGGRALLVELEGGVRVTPYHPVFVAGEWRFPADVAAAEERECDAVCSLVLAGAPALIVGAVPCAALGHGIQEGAARHPYFGTDRVIEDLAGAPGFERGLVNILPGNTIRDPETGLVAKLSFSTQ